MFLLVWEVEGLGLCVGVVGLVFGIGFGFFCVVCDSIEFWCGVCVCIMGEELCNGYGFWVKLIKE